MSKKLLVPITLLLVFSLAVGCKPAPKPPIKIAVQGPITGKWAYEGEGFVKCVKLLAEEINEKGGLLGGRMIEIIEADDKGEPSDSSLVAAKMVDEGVVAVVGSYSSTCTEPASAIYNEANILQITPSSTATVLTTKGYKQFFRTCFLDDRQGLFVAEKFKDWGIKKVFFLHDNSTYAKGLAEWAKKYHEERGGEALIDAITPGETDYTPILTKIKAEAPDAIYFTGYHPDGGLLVKQARELGLMPDILFTAGNACNNPEFIEIAGKDAAEGVLVSTEPLPHDLPYPEAKEFIKKFEAKYGEPPASIWWVMAADAFNVIVEAIKATNSTDTDKMAKYLHEEFKNYPGITGPIIGFDEKGDRLGTIHKWYVIRNGEFVPYEK